jgi:hypothetical protein
MRIIDYRCNKAQVSQTLPPQPSPSKAAHASRRSSWGSVSTCERTAVTASSSDEPTFLSKREAENLLTKIRLSIDQKAERKQRLERRLAEALQLSQALYISGSLKNAVVSMRKYSKYQVQLERAEAVQGQLIEFLVEMKAAVLVAQLEQIDTDHRRVWIELDVEREFMGVVNAAVEQRLVATKTDQELLHELREITQSQSQPPFDYMFFM